MKSTTRKRLLSGFCAIAMTAASICSTAAGKAEAANQSTAEWQTSDVYSGSNVEGQNYIRWTQPIESYLVTCSDGNLMRVQNVSSTKSILVEYYDSSYHLLSSKTISQELPIFGGFYETEQSYFLLTGQANQNESSTVEVYRITKYDKDWNRLASAGLHDCNTTVPFDAGSARMDAAGNYLLIRTCHEMYQSSDGYNHQANVTIQLDMQNMRITDAFTDVMNSSFGYVSHSFNQFIKVDNDHIVALDHGDAYPRSIVLTKYASNVSSGTFTPNYYTPCKVTDVLAFPGTPGNNATGASVGGFEITDSSYLAAGNSVVQDSNNLSNKTRNVFAAAVDKNTGRVTMNWLTNYAEGEPTASTPHMVKAGADKYMVLWSRDRSTVYYTMVNGSGKQTDTIYEINGNLSDCVPVAANDKLIWYTWDDENIVFYEINLNNLSESQTKAIKNGEPQETVTNPVQPDTDITINKISKINLISVKSASRGKMTLSWEPDVSGDGCQIAYSINKQFPSDKTSYKNVKPVYSTKTISGLSRGKTYYARIRAYKTVDGKKYYGEWSDIKKIKIKK